MGDDYEDEEERRKRIQAQENGEALGTVLGLAIGAVASMMQDDEDNEKQNEETDWQQSM